MILSFCFLPNLRLKEAETRKLLGLNSPAKQGDTMTDAATGMELVKLSDFVALDQTCSQGKRIAEIGGQQRPFHRLHRPEVNWN